MAYQQRGRQAQKELFDGSGVIEAVSRTGTTFKIGNDWYSVFSADQMAGAQKGDEIEFQYSVNNKGGKDFLNVQGDLTIVNEGGGGQSRPAPARGSADRPASARSSGARQAPAARSGGGATEDTRQRSIVRQNSLTQANALFGSLAKLGVIGETDLETAADEVIALARKFEAYSMLEDGE